MPTIATPPTKAPDDILAVVPNLPHLHHLDEQNPFPERKCTGEQDLKTTALWANLAGFRSVILTPHATNTYPGDPHALQMGDEQTSAIKRYAADLMSRHPHGVPRIYVGIEENILEDGELCTPNEVLRLISFVIASFHGTVPSTANEVYRRLAIVAENPYVDLIGHPGRYLEGIPDIDWDAIFANLRANGKMVEANANAVWSKGSVNLRRRAKSLADWREAGRVAEIEREFYAAMGRSGVQVVVSLDIHNAGMWPTDVPDHDWRPSYRDLYEFLAMIIGAGVSEINIVNSSLEGYIEAGRAPLLVP